MRGGRALDSSSARGGVRCATQPPRAPPLRQGAGCRASRRRAAPGRAPAQSGVRRSRSSGSCARPDSTPKRSSPRSPERSACQAKKWDERPVGAGDRLRRAGRARGEGDVGQVVRGHGDLHGVAASAASARWTARSGPSGRSRRRGSSAARARSAAGGSPGPASAKKARGRAWRRHSSSRRAGWRDRATGKPPRPPAPPGPPPPGSPSAGPRSPPRPRARRRPRRAGARSGGSRGELAIGPGPPVVGDRHPLRRGGGPAREALVDGALPAWLPGAATAAGRRNRRRSPADPRGSNRRASAPGLRHELFQQTGRSCSSSASAMRGRLEQLQVS